MKRRLLLVCCLAGLALVPALAQSARFMDGLVASPAINAGQAAYLVAVSAELAGEDATPQECLDLIERNNWGGPTKAADAAITLADFSLWLCKAYKVKGGFLYQWFPGPRYAFRELAFAGVMPYDAAPDMACSGPESMRILNKMMERKQ